MQQNIIFLENFKKYSDVELMEMFSKPKPICDRAFQVIYTRYSARLNSFCLFKVHNQMEAEEIFQQTWIRFFNSVAGGKQLECVLPFLLSIAKNLVIDYFRATKTRTTHIVDMTEPEMLEEIAEKTSINPVECNELGELIQAAVNCLDDKYKEAFILKRYDDLSLEEISKFMNISLSTAKQRVSRATKMVRDILAPHIKDYINIENNEIGNK